MKRFGITLVPIFILLLGCKDTNKTIPTVINNEEPSITLNQVPSASVLHTVTINEVIPTSDSIYVNVNEGSKTFWIATKPTDVKTGQTYYYLGGDLKTNYKSKTLDKVFDELYIIGNLVSSDHGTALQENNGMNQTEFNKDSVKKEDTGQQTVQLVTPEGPIKIAELVKNPKKYEGKIVQIEGKCTKVNAGIMNRNWMHIQDGSQDDYDLVVTSNNIIPVGTKATIQALVTLNKDFGAGYKYDLILEQGKIID